MKTAAELDRMPMAEYFGYRDGFEGGEYRNTWTRAPTNDRAAIEYKRGYDAGIADRKEDQEAIRKPMAADWLADAEQAAADLADELDTQRDAIGRG